MKIANLIILLSLVTCFVACKKVENKVYFEGGTSPVISASTTAVRLQAGEEANNAIKFSWTNPNYKFTTGLSSQDVTYTLEIDTVGGNFKSGALAVFPVSRETSYTFTVGEFNKLLTTGLPGGKGMGLQINPRRSYNLEARVTSSIGGAVPLISTNKVTFSASPFPPPPKVNVPIAGTLWITGNAVASDWSNPFGAGSPYLTSQRFAKLSDTDYELTVTMIPGGGYKLIQAQGDWGSQYSFKSGNSSAGEFQNSDGPNFPGPTVAGNYKLKFDFQTGTYTVVKQ